MIKPKRRTRKPKGIAQEIPSHMIKIGDTILEDRLPPQLPKVLIKSSSYYLNNRKIFINFISSLFAAYKDQLAATEQEITCDAGGEERPFALLTHQKIVRDYLNLYTPYRGLLLYHGLGSGKTCSSIALAEGMKTDRQVIVMTPASLRMNYVEELKKCGDSIYRKNQFWEFISSREHPEFVDALSNIMSLSVDFIQRAGGVWLVNIKKRPNFEALNASQRASLDKQLNEMIMAKYKFINYNGSSCQSLAELY